MQPVKIVPRCVLYGTFRTTLEHIRNPRDWWNSPGARQPKTKGMVTLATISAHLLTEAGKQYRRLPAAQRRADLARTRAQRTGKPEHVTAAIELQAGYERMTVQYFETLAQAL